MGLAPARARPAPGVGPRAAHHLRASDPQQPPGDAQDVPAVGGEGLGAQRIESGRGYEGGHGGHEEDRRPHHRAHEMQGVAADRPELALALPGLEELLSCNMGFNACCGNIRFCCCKYSDKLP